MQDFLLLLPIQLKPFISFNPAKKDWSFLLQSFKTKWAIKSQRLKISNAKPRRSSAVGASSAPNTKTPPNSSIKPPIPTSSPNPVSLSLRFRSDRFGFVCGECLVGINEGSRSFCAIEILCDWIESLLDLILEFSVYWGSDMIISVNFEFNWWFRVWFLS